MWYAYFCMGAYKHNVVLVIKIGHYIHGVLVLCGCLVTEVGGGLPFFYSLVYVQYNTQKRKSGEKWGKPGNSGGGVVPI